jgi:hypothetical protein
MAGRSWQYHAGLRTWPDRQIADVTGKPKRLAVSRKREEIPDLDESGLQREEVATHDESRLRAQGQLEESLNEGARKGVKWI